MVLVEGLKDKNENRRDEKGVIKKQGKTEELRDGERLRK